VDPDARRRARAGRPARHRDHRRADRPHPQARSVLVVALIEMRAIERTYVMGDNLVHALRGVDLTIEAGSSIAIMGTSGSGKSTMMNIMGCLDQPTRGNYLLNGKDVARLSRTQLADVRGRMIGFVFQSFNL